MYGRKLTVIGNNHKDIVYHEVFYFNLISSWKQIFFPLLTLVTRKREEISPGKHTLSTVLNLWLKSAGRFIDLCHSCQNHSTIFIYSAWLHI